MTYKHLTREERYQLHALNNNIARKDHRAIKRITRPMLEFKSFWRARVIIAGVKTMHMIRKGQLNSHAGQTMSAAQQFYCLAV